MLVYGFFYPISTFMKYLHVILLVLFTTSALFAQEYDESAQVEIEVQNAIADKIIYTGQIQSESTADTIILLTKNNHLVKIPRKDIISMESANDDKTSNRIEEYRKNNPIPAYNEVASYSFNEKGFYCALNPVLNLSGENGLQVTPGAELVLGHRFSRMLGVGVGISVNRFTWRVSPNAIAGIFAEARGYFLPKKVSPYYRVKVGYGNSLSRENNLGFTDFNSSKGGLLAGGGIGLRFLGNSKIQLNLETGWNFQRITYNNLSNGAEFRKYNFNRHYIGFGLMF